MLSGRYGIKCHDVFGERQYGTFCCGHHDLNIACSYCNAGTYYAVCERVASRFFRFTVCFHYASRAFADRPRGDCEAVLQKQVGQAVHALPLVSVIGIVAIVSSVVSVNREHLLQSGLLIVSVVILHNGIGYLLGFLTAKLFRMDYASQKAIAIEVGMQNSGLGAALATAHFSPLSAVPSAIFSIWHNLSGSVLATYWSKKKKTAPKKKRQRFRFHN